MGAGAGKQKEHDVSKSAPAPAALAAAASPKAAPQAAPEAAPPAAKPSAEPPAQPAAPPAAKPAGEPVKAPSAPTSPAKKAPPKQAKADGESSASQVVGGSWSPPKGPSPEDENVINEWESQGKLHKLQGVWCHVPYKVTIVVPEDATEGHSKVAAQNILDGVAKEAEDIFSHFVDHSEVSKINKMAAEEVHQPSEPMRKVLGLVATLNRTTRGSFDPAILPLAQYFKEKAASGDFSGSEEIASYSKWSMFQLDDAGLKKKHAKAMLDLCGLAKGWAIDEMSQRLKDAGFTASFVDWGGDIKVTGKHPVGRCWAAAVVEPPKIDEIGGELPSDDKKHYLAYLDLRDGQAVATSGDYLQTLADGMSHIIDPKAGEPCEIADEKCATVSVVNTSCMLADGLATAAMAKGKIKDARMMLDMFRGHQMKDPVDDYLLFTREGPRVVRMQIRAQEDKALAEDRLSRHNQAHVVIVGGGLAGVSAAIEAYKANAKVTLIEKEKDLGGNSAKATSGINACGTRVQFGQGVDDDGRYFERDTHVSAKGGKSDIGCVTMLSEKSSEAINFLIDELGINLTVLTQLGGHARKRTHRVPPRSDGTPVPVGYTMMQHARGAVAGIPDIEMKTECAMTGLIKSETDREVLGIKYREKDGPEVELRCDAVVLTTGGFGFDHSESSLMQKWRPDLVGVPTTNGSFADGLGVKLGEDVGATLIDMDKVQLHPTAFIDPKDPASHTKYLGPEALRGSGGILLDQRGKRFVDELNLRSVVSKAILDTCDPYDMPDGTKYRPWAWCVLNEESQEKFGRPMLLFYKDQVGLFEAVQGTKGLSELIGCPEENVVETLKAYAAACDTKICQRTGKVVFPTRVCETDQSFIVARITPCIHYCMGGLEISPDAEVLCCSSLRAFSPRDEKKASELAMQASKGSLGKRAKVKRLFAAGECTGGVHGGNRLGGNSLLECVVFGRLAGQRAATINQKEETCLGSGDWVPVRLREIRATDIKYGHNTAVYRFALHGSLQHTGLEVGRYIAVRGEIDGDTVTGYYSPISRPDDEGIISVLCRTDDKGGPIVKLLTSLRPGASLMMKGMGGPRLSPHVSDAAWTYNGRNVRRFSLLAGGTGLAPALQIARAYFNNLQNHTEDDPNPEGGIKIVYAAESAGDLAFVQAFESMTQRYKGLISYYSVLNNPPAGWTQGVGFVDPDCMRKNLWFPPSDDHLLVMCGPPIFEKIMCGNLKKMGYPREQYYSFDADENGGA